MIDISKFMFIKKLKAGRYGNGGVTIYKTGNGAISSTLGDELLNINAIDIGLSANGQEILIQKGTTFNLIPDKRTKSNFKKFTSKELAYELQKLNISFPAKYDVKKIDDVFLGELIEK